MSALGCIVIALALPGGSIVAHETHMRTFDAWGCRIRIEGRCDSACTVFLGARDVCVTRQASLGFHAAHCPPGAPSCDPAAASRRMAAHYPPAIRAWYLAGPAHSPRRTAVSGAELIRHGVKECEG